MDQDVAINKVLRDMKQAGLITLNEEGEVRSGEARVHLKCLWGAATTEKSKQMAVRHTRKIEEYDRMGNKLQEFDSVVEASRTLKIPRSTIDYTLFGKTKNMRNGHYFRYAEDEKEGNDRDTDTAGEG